MKTTFYRESLGVNVTKEDIKKRILEESDFIKSYKYGNSMAKFLSKNDKELDDSVIARLLMIDKEEVEDIYRKAVEMLKKGIEQD
jgi:Sec7-like guanine-nucleotide exchange factor